MCCRWPLFAFALLCAGTVAATAQPPIEPKDGKYVVPLTVDAVAPARPALKYRLLPDIREVQPGNQIQAFYKSQSELAKLADKLGADRLGLEAFGDRLPAGVRLARARVADGQHGARDLARTVRSMDADRHPGDDDTP